MATVGELKAALAAVDDVRDVILNEVIPKFDRSDDAPVTKNGYPTNIRKFRIVYTVVRSKGDNASQEQNQSLYAIPPSPVSIKAKLNEVAGASGPTPEQIRGAVREIAKESFVADFEAEWLDGVPDGLKPVPEKDDLQKAIDAHIETEIAAGSYRTGRRFTVLVDADDGVKEETRLAYLDDGKLVVKPIVA